MAREGKGDEAKTCDIVEVQLSVSGLQMRTDQLHVTHMAAVYWSEGMGV